jgi:hypothetical protein
MNGFTLHLQKHTSPSSINMWATSPDAWIAKYLLGRKFPSNAAMKAGNAVEEGIVRVLKGETLEDAIKGAVGNYNKQILFMGDDKARDRIETIPPMITMGVEALKEYGEPEWNEEAKQKSVSIKCKGNGWELPVIGYLDFHFPKHGLIIDCKTTAKMPSDMSKEHKRQAAIYKAAMGNQIVKFMYITPKKLELYEDDAHNDSLTEIKTILNRQERFLSISKDVNRLKELVHVTDSYYWSNAESIRSELFGM